MATRNDITGDLIKSRGNTIEFRDNYDDIFAAARKRLAERESKEGGCVDGEARDGTDSVGECHPKGDFVR